MEIFTKETPVNKYVEMREKVGKIKENLKKQIA
jgi:hypothetical protein